MREDIQDLIRSRRHCVLATVADNQPYCSLMAYTASDDCTRIFMATYRNTRKFQNLLQTPRVSLLIDSRDGDNPQALTVQGEFAEVVDDRERQFVYDHLLADHPDLQSFLDYPDIAFIRVRISALVFLNGLTDAHYEAVET